MNEAIILDVGHGNCSILRSNELAAVVDSPSGGILINALQQLGVTRVDAAFISHADADHLAGILSLLTSDSLTVDTVYINPDAGKASKLWRDFRTAAGLAAEKGTKFKTSLTSSCPGEIVFGDMVINVIAPSPSLALGGAGGKDVTGRKIDSNSLSAVLQICFNDESILVLPGDLDNLGLQNLINTIGFCPCKILVYPHHGGLPRNANYKEFASSIIREFTPKYIVFSNGRGKHDNPRQEVLEEIRQFGAQVACTQLCERCCQDVNDVPNSLQVELPSAGERAKSSCAGTIRIELSANNANRYSHFEYHREFIRENIPIPQCKRK